MSALKNQGVRAYVVAISGSTSSGKSTMAILLREIFAGFGLRGHRKDVAIVHQDSYFRCKTDCPIVKLQVASGPAIDAPNTDCDAAIDFVNLSKEVGALISGEKPASYLKIGSSFAISEEAYEERVLQLQKEHSKLIAHLQSKVGFFLGRQATENAELDFKGRLVSYSARVRRGTGANYLFRTSGERIRPIMIFVEGLLLYSPQHLVRAQAVKNEGIKAKIIDNRCSLSNEDWDILDKSPALTEDYDDNDRENEVDEALEVNIDVERALTQSEGGDSSELNLASKLALQSIFDVKLFLEQSKNTIKSRRFARPEYIDEELGGMRKPEQHWRKEEYFHDIAWPEHEAAHQWLLECGNGDRDVDGIEVRADDQGGVEAAVTWAVAKILDDMASSEENARFEW